MRLLSERYWLLASEAEVAAKELAADQATKRWQPARLAKSEDEYALMDRVVSIVEGLLAQ